MYNIYLIYAPLFIAVFLVFLGSLVYYVQGYEITDNNDFNKYKLSSKNILIKLKLFKYDNRFNYFLLIPYLITWNLFFIIFILYIIYWCGLTGLESFFASKWVNFPLCGLIFLIMMYDAFIRQKILYSYTPAKPDFITDKEKKQEEKDNTE